MAVNVSLELINHGNRFLEVSSTSLPKKKQLNTYTTEFFTNFGSKLSIKSVLLQLQLL